MDRLIKIWYVCFLQGIRKVLMIFRSRSQGSRFPVMWMNFIQTIYAYMYMYMTICLCFAFGIDSSHRFLGQR